jgi:hypothetical protein
MKEELFKVLKILPTDYFEYGGEIDRWKYSDKNYPDCSGGCKYFTPLAEDLGFDWGVCANPNGPRAGLLTWEHQAGFDCYERENNE